MAYEGETLDICPQVPYDFSETYAVVVSGWGPNFCGHQLLNLQGADGVYLHVAEWHGRPRIMDRPGYDRYLEENKKRELNRFRVNITNPQAAMMKLEELLSKKWLWGVLPHNCASFVEEIVRAGGSSAGLFFNCPALERFAFRAMPGRTTALA